MSQLKGKKILVTGGTGSIGSELVRKLLLEDPEVIRIFSRDESKQFFMQQEFSEFTNIRYLIGDIRDKNRLKYAVNDIDIVFHVAALKHVPSCEYNPFEAVKTNVFGVQNLLEVAIEENIEKLVAISTDKVVSPSNTMGATKLLSEKIILAAEYYKGSSRTIFTCVRFGNVMGSRGSVIPLFKSQIQKDTPLTITDGAMTRFFMSISEAAELVIRASELAKGGELFVLKMPSMKIQDLANTLINDFNSKSIHQQYERKVNVIGRRIGEKIHEELLTSDEVERAYENETMFLVPSPFLDSLEISDSFKKTTKELYSSKVVSLKNEIQIKEILGKNGLLF